jgi:hypothetical protein
MGVQGWVQIHPDVAVAVLKQRRALSHRRLQGLATWLDRRLQGMQRSEKCCASGFDFARRSLALLAFGP